ncbi:kelch-like protein 9 [Genypterus blacodes]|uniref:kelch-like protein 9 n=1 Tax=Genypterus blacodes TaxID=154954 RepID=UPI003F75C1C3
MERSRRRRWRDWLNHWDELGVIVGEEEDEMDGEEEEVGRERSDEEVVVEEEKTQQKLRTDNEEDEDAEELESLNVKPWEIEDKIPAKILHEESGELGEIMGEEEEGRERSEEEAEVEEKEEGNEADAKWDVTEEEEQERGKGKEGVEREAEEEEVQEGKGSGKDERYVRRTEDEEPQPNQGWSGLQEDTLKEDGNISESEESDDEISHLEPQKVNDSYMRSDSEEDEDPEEWQSLHEKPWITDDNIPGAQISHKEHKGEEDESGIECDDNGTVAESRSDESISNQEENFSDDQEELTEEEEESTDDEETKCFSEEDADSDEENATKVYCKDGYPTDVFHTLRSFRDSSLLTDLTLSTAEGRSIDMHAPVLAAVSSLIRDRLRENAENPPVDERLEDIDVGLHRWTLYLGPEVDHVGLQAVVEFAYSGVTSTLNKATIGQIKAAAQTLGVPRVLDLCTEEEESRAKREGEISAAEQMTISLQSIEELWLDKIGCDVSLEALGASLRVHRVILAASCDYFRGMFTLGMKESRQPSVMLPFLLASELEVLIRCSYSGTLPLSWRSVFEFTSTSLQLQCQPALSLCLSFLHQEIDPHSCLDVASFAEAYEMMPLLELAHDFVLRHFQMVASTSKFKDLPAKKLLKYLNSSSLCVPSELVVFRAVAAWIQAKPKIRWRLARELMKTIHFPLMTFTEFKEVTSLNMWSHHSLKELYNTVFETFCSNDAVPQSQCRIYLPKDSLVLVGGDCISEDFSSRSISRDLWFGNSIRNHTGIVRAMEWRKLGEMPETPRFSHEVAVLNGQLYVIGGKSYYGISDTLNSVYRYDLLQNSWERLADLQEKRCYFSVIVLNEKLYAIGGQCEPDYSQSVERFCPTANSWSFTKPLDQPLSGHVAKVLQGQIFVSGGLNQDYNCLASMALYHPEKGNTCLENMTKPRAKHCMETLGGRLYVAGGISTDGNIAMIDQLACEVYSPLIDCWTAFTSLPVPHVGAGSGVLEGKFYVLGGYSQEDCSDTKAVHRYDPTAQQWETMGKMPGPNNDIRAVLLCLPPDMRI